MLLFVIDRKDFPKKKGAQEEKISEGRSEFKKSV